MVCLSSLCEKRKYLRWCLHKVSGVEIWRSMRKFMLLDLDIIPLKPLDGLFDLAVSGSNGARPRTMIFMELKVDG